MKTILNRLLPARDVAPGPRSTLAPESDRDGTRREIVAMALRDVLRKSGIPPTWITANPQVSITAKRERGVHLHLMIRDWHPQLLVFLVVIERQVRARTLRLDPFSAEWLTGMSWRFDLVDDTACPSLPSAHFWQEYLRRMSQFASAPPGSAATSLPSRPRAVLLDTPASTRADVEPAFLPTQPMTH